MSVELDPPELGFKRPFQQEVSQVLRLKNHNSDPVAFKVKTTAPKQYCVRPNSGRIEPGKDVEVQILLQAMKEDPPADAKCRDKFLVQSVLVTADKEFSNVAQLWSHMEQTSKQSIQEKKIRVTFLPADDHTGTPPKDNRDGHRDEHSILSSPSPEAFTPKRDSSDAPAGAARPESAYTDAKNKHTGDEKEASASLATTGGLKSAISTAAANVANAVPTSSADLQSQLAEARATIAKLRQQAETSSGLRQRGAMAGPTPDSKGQLATAQRVQTPAGGVSVQVTAGLCLLSFLLAYFLF